MQYSYIPVLKKSYKIPLEFIIKCIFCVIIISYLFLELNKEEDLLKSVLSSIRKIFENKSLIYLLIPVIFVAFNWAAEAKKWQILSRKVVNLDFLNSLKGVLSGLSMGFITPQSIGEYAGRILQINHERRYELAGAILFGSFIQFSISILFGLLGAGIFLQKQNVFLRISDLHISIILLSMVFLLVFVMLSRKVLPKLSAQLTSFVVRNLKIISTYSFSDLLQLIIFSIARYIIFVTQFVIVLILFDVDLPIGVLISGVTWIFAAKTVIPAFNFLSDIGVREFSALLFFNQYHVDTSSIVLASLFIWVINILAPTIAGSLLVLRMKLKR